jgi:hypothetical protein
MAEPTQTPGMFREPPVERTFPRTAIAIASVAVLILVGVLILLGHRKAPPPAPTTLQPNAPYAANLTISDIQMSEADSRLGGKSTYIDGHIVNHGPSTVTGMMAQVVFANDDGQPPQISTTQMLLIRARQPYIDTEMISSAPIAPGASADFRLIFESVPDDWNTQTPVLHLTEISTR